MNLTQWRRRRKDAVIALLFPIFTPSFPAFSPVIPAKAGIQTVADKLAARKRVCAGGTPALPGTQTYPYKALYGRRLG